MTDTLKPNQLELLEKIRLGEDSFLELKEVHFDGGKVRGPRQDDLADELAALANAWGGVLLLGIDDKTRIATGIPVDNLDDVEMLVRQACEESIKPSLAPRIERINLPDEQGEPRSVIRVDMPRSLYIHLSPGGYYHRVGSSKRIMEQDFLARMMQQRSQSRIIRFDESIVHRATLDDLDEALWRRFAPADSADAPEILLSKLSMAGKDEEGSWRPSVAGLLLACPEPQEFMSSAYIQAVAYRGNDINTRQYRYQLDAKDITGPWTNRYLMPANLLIEICVLPLTRGEGAAGWTSPTLTCKPSLRHWPTPLPTETIRFTAARFD